jgi:hypothetical protein
MKNEIIETIENIEDGTKCNIVLNTKGTYNVVFIDSDSDEMIQATCFINNYDNAVLKANNYLNIK